MVLVSVKHYFNEMVKMKIEIILKKQGGTDPARL